MTQTTPSPTKDKTDNNAKINNSKEKKEDEIPEEDLELVENLNLCVTRLSDPKLIQASLGVLETLLKSSTSSMTSIPKPLKYLKPHYPTLVDLYEKNKNKHLADVISVLCMGFEVQGESLKYRLLGEGKDVGSWGHEYVRHLASEIITSNSLIVSDASDTTANTKKKELLDLAMTLVPFFMSHNAEPDAIDLLIELESLNLITSLIDSTNYTKVCLYILGCVHYVTSPDDALIMDVAHNVYLKMGQYPAAIQVALRMNNRELIETDFESCTDPLVKKQLAYILARQQIYIDTEDETLIDIQSNTNLSKHFLQLATDLNVVEAKVPEDVFKSHLETKNFNVDSAQSNLASTYVNAFLNAGFGNDKLMAEEDGSWIYKNKDQGMLSAVASLGMLMLWDIDNGLAKLDKYLYNEDDNIKAGALLGIALISSGVRNEADPALALLSEHLNSPSPVLQATSIFGLGLAYAGTCREEVKDVLAGLVSGEVPLDVASLAGLALGLVYSGSGDGDIASTILQTLMEREPDSVPSENGNSNASLGSFGRLLGVGLGLVFFGTQEAAEASLETLKVIEGDLAYQTGVIVEVCAYAGTGNVLKIQKMLHYCNDHFVPNEDASGSGATSGEAGAEGKEPEKVKDSTFQAFAVIGMSVIAMGEEIGSHMVLRQFSHLMHYGEQVIRRAVPLAMSYLCASNPMVSILDTLSKYSHDHDGDVSRNAIFAMGIVGAGTNNARLAQMLRQLAAYYHKEPSHLFVVRVSQGLLHMGKGTLTINPLTFNRTLTSARSACSLFSLLIALTDPKVLYGKHHFILFLIVPAIYPRFLMTLDENGGNVGVLVRVGQAVDVVGQAGRPKTITGFQTHTTPVLMGYTERAEIATEEFVAVSDVLEGFVLVKKNEEVFFVDRSMSVPGKKITSNKYWE